MTRWDLPVSRPYLLALLSGLLLAVSVPPSMFSWLGIVAMVPLFLFLQIDKQRHLLWSWVAGTMYGSAVMLPTASLTGWWWVSAYAPPAYAKAFFGLIILLASSLFIGGMFCIFALLYRRYVRNLPWTVIPAVTALVWPVLEKGREILMLNFSFTWGHLGYLLHEFPRLIQIADTGGVYSVSALFIFINSVLMLGVLSAVKKDYKKTGFYALALVAVLIAVTEYGSDRIAEYRKKGGGENVAVIYTSLTTQESSSLENYREHLRLTEGGLKTGAGLVVLPENIFPFFVFDEATGFPKGYEDKRLDVGKLYDDFLALSVKYPDAVIVGGLHSVAGGGRYNSALTWRNGKAEIVYRKMNLLPLAEKIPGPFSRSHIHPFSAGDRPSSLTLKSGRVEILICSEITASGPFRKSGLIINIGNDNIFSHPWIGEYNRILARFRAIESRTFVIRALKGGISGIINPAGYIVEEAAGGNGIILYKI